MNDILRRSMRSALLFMSACFAMWAFVPDGRTVAAGLILGTAASLMNALLLRRRIDLISKAAAERGARRVSLGLGFRLATVLLAAMIAYRYPEQFHLAAVLAGCFYVQFAAFITAIIYNMKGFDGKG